MGNRHETLAKLVQVSFFEHWHSTFGVANSGSCAYCVTEVQFQIKSPYIKNDLIGKAFYFLEKKYLFELVEYIKEWYVFNPMERIVQFKEKRNTVVSCIASISS